QLLAPVVEAVDERLAPGDVLLALEGARDLTPGRPHQRPELVAQLTPLAGREAQRLRRRRVPEVVDVAPVVGPTPLARRPLDERPDGGGLARPRRAGDVDVVAAVGDPKAERERVGGPPLPDQLGGLPQLGGGFEREPAGVARPPDLLRAQAVGRTRIGPRSHHALPRRTHARTRGAGPRRGKVLISPARPGALHRAVPIARAAGAWRAQRRRRTRPTSAPVPRSGTTGTVWRCSGKNPRVDARAGQMAPSRGECARGRQGPT